MKSNLLKILLSIILFNSYSANLSASEQDDPYQSFNRAMFAVHETIDLAIKPIAEVYDQYTPLPVRVSLKSGLANLGEPIIALNNTLQGKPTNALSDLGRFIINSTLGIFGLFDVASEMELKKNDEDFGQTLAVWGVPEGGYVFLPLLGPRTLRDTASFAVDSQFSLAGYTFQAVDLRASLLGLDTMLDAASDKYVFIRDAYLKNRRAAVADGVKNSLNNTKKIEDEEDFYDAGKDGDSIK